MLHGQLRTGSRIRDTWRTRKVYFIRVQGRAPHSSALPLPASCLPCFALPEWIIVLSSSSQRILGGLTDGGCSAAPILPSYQRAASHTEPSESITAEDRLGERRVAACLAAHVYYVPYAANCLRHRSFCVQPSFSFSSLLSLFLAHYLTLFLPPAPPAPPPPRGWD